MADRRSEFFIAFFSPQKIYIAKFYLVSMYLYHLISSFYSFQTLPDFLARGGVDRLPEIYNNMYKEFGNVYSMSIMGSDQLMLSDPRSFDTVLRSEGKYPIGGKWINGG